MKKHFSIFLFILILFILSMVKENTRTVMNMGLFLTNDREKIDVTIAIDPGHGGFDPGKVGVNNALEKDINLDISLKLKALLEEAGAKVIMTREEDIGLYEPTASNKKRSDMNNRIEIINSNQVDLAVSIHQNSFTEEYVKGAQVFYHGQSAEGKELALILQDSLVRDLPGENHRKAKANESYYMLKKTNCPLVIVECGYLSNYKEAALLVTEEYQDAVAKAIYNGILEYIAAIKEKTG